MLTFSSYTNPFFYIQFVYFLIAFILSFTIPGYILLSRVLLKKQDKLIVGTSLGITMWALQGIIFGYLNMRSATYLYVIFFIAIFLIKTFSNYSKKQINIHHVFSYIKKFDMFTSLLVFVGSFSLLAYIFVVGMQVPTGVTFCCGQVPDNIMHIAYINEFIIWLQKKTAYAGFLYAIVLGTLIGFKIYTGLFMLSGLGLLSCYFLLRKQFSSVMYPICALIVSLAIYLPVNAGAGGLFFTGFWKVEDFIVTAPLGLSHLELAKQVYFTHHNWLRVIEYEGIFTCIFLIVTFGTKLLGLVQTKKTLSYFPVELNILLIGGMVACFFAGMFFIQNSGGANTVFFIIEIYILASFYAALSCTNLFTRLQGITKILCISFVIGLTIPLPLYEIISGYTGGLHASATVHNNELQALNYIRNNTNNNSIFIVDPKFVLDYQTPYVSFLADRPMYLSGQLTELGEHDIKLPKRVNNSKTIFTNTNPQIVKTILNQTNISYIYLPSSESLPCCTNEAFFEVIYDNKTAKVIRFKLH